MKNRDLMYQVNQDHEVAVIELQGDISGSSEHALNAAYAEAMRYNPDAVQLDFGGVGFISSSGIAVLVGLMAQARKSGRRFLARNLSPHYQEVFQMTRISDFMTMV